MLNNKVDPGTISRIPEVVEAYRTDPLVHSRISARILDGRYHEPFNDLGSEEVFGLIARWLAAS